ncbi:MAG: GAF domain-containing protein [Oscillatoriophycideae cyanobacterium NC_groundwater_1537_Pr4_S-0.65um_50_18]|nr:GAF domain-containing protein [Oscillatoriophycideae cyanobacterium NC_groundwater_1537_Pr4_S-0.65um_50_18]
MLMHTTVLTLSELQAAIVRNPLTVAPDTRVMSAIAHMSGIRAICSTAKTENGQLDELHLEARSSCVLIVENGQLLGILTERDIVRLSAQQRLEENLTVQEVMSRSVVTLHESEFTDLFSVVNILQQYHIRHLPILDEQDRLVGLVTNESLRHTSRPIDLLQIRLVSEVMTSQVICAAPDCSMLMIAQQMAAHHVSSVVVVNAKVPQPDIEPLNSRQAALLQIPVGIVTERDIVQFQALGLQLETCLAHTVMSTPLFAVQPHDSLWVVQQMMEQRLIRRLAVTGEQGELLGIVTQTSLLQALNPLEIYKLATVLKEKVVQLETEKIQLLESRTLDLEQQVESRTIALKAQAEREQLVAEIATQIRSSLSLQIILDTTATQIRQLLNCDRVNIWQFEADGQMIAVAESTDSLPSMIGRRVNDICFQQDRLEAYRQGQIRVVPDIHTFEMADCHRDMLAQIQTRAKILVPLLCGDELWGLLIATESQHAREWQLEEVELLKVLSVQLAIALQQATTHQKLQDQLVELQQAEARLRESEHRYITLTAAAPVGIFRTDAEGNSIYINQRCCEMLGLPVEDTFGNRWQEAVHPEDREQVIAATIRSRQENRPFQLEYRILRPDGTVTWVLGQAVAERDAAGQVIGYVGTITDISEQQAARAERQQVEAALIQSEAQSRAVLEAIPDFMIRMGADGIYREFVTGNREIDILPKDFDSTGFAMVDVLPAEIAARQHYYLAQALSTGELQVYEQQIQIGDRLQDEEVRVIKSGEDEVLFMIRDISDRKRSEKALRKSEAHQRALISAIPDLIMRINRAGIYLEFVANPNFHVVGNLSEMVGTHVSASLPPEVAKKRLECIQRVLETNSTQMYEQDLSKDGRTQIEEVRLVPYSEDEVLGLVRDISDRKQAEAALQNLITGTAATTGQDFFPALVSYIAQALYVSYAIVSEQVDEELHVLAFWANGALQPTFSYHPAQTPCERALQDGQFYCVSYVQAAFPEDLDLVEMAAYSYLGVALKDTQGRAIGNLCILSQQTIQNPQRAEQILRVFAARAAAELERQRASTQLERLNQDLEARVEQRTSDLQTREAQLRESQKFLETLLDTFPLIVFWKDLQSVYLGCNQNAATAAGFTSPSDIIGKTDDELWGSLASELYQANDREVIETGTSKLGLVKSQQHADGSIVWIETNKLPLRNLKGEIIGILGTSQNITDRKQAEQIVKQQAEREALLREITQRIRQSLDIQTIFDTACQEIRQGLQADRVGIFKFYPESNFDDGEFVAESVVAGFPSVVAMRVYDHCFGENYASLYAQGRFHAIDDIYHNGLQTCHTDILAQFQVRANLIMPLLCGDALWGLLCVHQCGVPRHWQQSEIDLTQQLANQLAIAIQQANLYEQIQSELLERQQAEARIALQLRRQEALGAIVQQIRESLDINQILATVTQQVKDVMHGDRVIVFQLHPDGKSQIVEEAVSHEFPALKNLHWDNEVWSQEILDCYWQGKPRIVADVMNDHWTDCLMTYNIEGKIQSKIVAPILQDGRDGEIHRWVPPWKTHKLWGVLVVHACQKNRVWQESEATVLQTIANQLAIAIQQASLFEQLQQELAERQQTEAKLTESNQQLAISNQELARATRLKDEFLASMSHELRTPLNAILGMTEGLQEGIFGSVNPQQIKALQTVERSGSHLLELINDILDVAKIEAGQVELDYSPISVAHLCQSSLAFIKQQALQKRIQLSIKLQPYLLDLIADERRIRQVLINLLNNAVKFTPEGGQVDLEVFLLPAEGGERDYLRIAVTDTGIGIAPENIKKLFQPFYQIDSALNRQYQGTGLGLVLVKRMVELHGGRVGLTSELGVGSCFTIDLPCTPDGSSSCERTATAQLTAPPKGDFLMAGKAEHQNVILLVEDHEANISTISSYLKAKGYRLLLATRGQEAIDMAVTHQPDLILMDIQMPGMDGLEVIRQIRTRPELDLVAIIALTALAMPNDRQKCLEAGANEYLTKPVRLKKLSQLITSLFTPSTP